MFPNDEWDIKPRKITLQDFDKICRLCLKKRSGLKSIHLVDPNDPKISVSYLLESYIFVDVSDNDCLPKNICVECNNELSRIYYFRNRCKQSENALRLILENETVLHELDTKSDAGNICNDDDNKEEEEEEEETIYIISSISDTPNDLDKTEGYLNDVSDENNILRENNNNIVSNEISFDNVKHDDISKSSFKLDNNGEKMLPFHASNHLTHLEFKCKICDSSFLNEESLREHSQKLKHSISHRQLNLCEVCSKWVPRGRMNQHMLSHTKKKPFKCKICGTGFTTSSNLRRHSTVHTGEKLYICEHCGKGFTQAGTMKTHKFTHDFYRTQSTDTGTKKHLRGHENPDKTSIVKNEPVYFCDVCKKGFKFEYHLKQHKVCHGEKSFLCSECGKRFSYKAGLQSHFRVHSGERPYKCGICSKAFGHQVSYQVHTLLHQGVKPYTCEVCHKNFRQRHHLKYHKRVHSGEKPYCCTFCGKSFALNGNLTVHLRTHTGETPYSCSLCGKGFIDTNKRKKHAKKCHSNTFSGIKLQ